MNSRGIEKILNGDLNCVEKDRLEMYNSLVQAVEKAGGAFDKDRHLNMKVHELIDLLGQNKIRFVYTGDRK